MCADECFPDRSCSRRIIAPVEPSACLMASTEIVLDATSRKDFSHPSLLPYNSEYLIRLKHACMHDRMCHGPWVALRRLERCRKRCQWPQLTRCPSR